jgi:predicted GIY-YIG superfamily endonuclease
MEEIDIRYLNSVIYILWCGKKFSKNFYVGSTKDLNERMQIHMSVCYNKNDKSYNNKKYKFIRKIGGFDNVIVDIIKKYPCKNSTELHIEENYWIKQLNPSLNSCGAYRTEEEKKEYNINYKLTEVGIQSVKKTTKKKYEKLKDNEDRQNYLKDYQNNWTKLPYKCFCCNLDMAMGGKSRHKKSKNHKINLLYMKFMFNRFIRNLKI